MSYPLYSVPSGSAGAGMTFDPAVAADLLADLAGLSAFLYVLKDQSVRLATVEGCGDFASGVALHNSLVALGAAASKALQQIYGVCTDVSRGIQQAAQRLLDQELANASDLERTHTERVTGARGTYNRTYVGESDREKLEGLKGRIDSPKKDSKAWPDMSNRSYSPADYNDKYIPGGADAGTYPTGASPENVAGPILDLAHQMFTTAQSDKVVMLAALWRGIADDLIHAFDAFNQRSKSHFDGHGGWTGNAADKIYQGLTAFSERGSQIGKEMARVGNATAHYGTNLGATKPGIDSLYQQQNVQLEHMIQSPLMAAAVPSQIAVLEQQARDLMTGFYNPGVATAASGMSYISDPHNPVASAPLLVPGMTPPPAPQGSKGASGPVPKALQTQSTATSPGSTNTGSSKSSNSSGSAQLTRAANADAVAKEAAAKAAAQQAAAQQAAAAKAGAGNPASAAQSAASQAAQAGKGLSGLGQGGAATKSASALANAEKAAAERAAKAAAGLGKGGGGGGAGGGLGGAAAAEKALQARAGSMGAAEKMIAAEQAALQNGRAGSPGMNGAPMGGARPGGEGGEGKGHKAARYLNSKANGEEIVGDEQEVAPTVIGGLNLDTTDDRPVRGGGTIPRR